MTSPTGAPPRPGGDGGGDDGVDGRARSRVPEWLGGPEVSSFDWGLLRQRVQARMEASSRYPTLVLGTVLFGLFTVGFTITILAVSLSTMADDLGASKSTLTWVITGPLLAFGVVGPTAGKAGDIWGHKRVYLLGLLGAGVFAIGIAASWDAPSVITFRILAAGFGAACGPASMAIIYSITPVDRRAQAMGWWSMVMAGGPVLGVVAGGPVVEALSWRWIFVVQAPLVFFGVLVAALLLPETVRTARTRFDVAGALLLSVGVTSALFALNRGPVMGWTSPVVLGGFILSPVALAAFVRQERRAESPLIRLEYLRRRNVAAPIATQLLQNFAYMGGFIITPFFLSEVFGYGATRIGLLSIARPLSYSLSAPLGGHLSTRIGERSAGVIGASAVAGSMVLMAGLGGSSPDALVMLGLALSGVGLGISSPSMAATVANAVDDEDLGVVGASQQLASQVGVVAGIQLMQTVQVSLAAGGLEESYTAAYLLGAGVAALGIVTASFVRRSGAPRAAGEPVGAESAREALARA